MKFTYMKITEEHYDRERGETTAYGDDVVYEATDSEVVTALVEIISDFYFDGKDTAVKASIRKFISDSDVCDELAEIYEDSLKEYFEPLAMAS